jgi:hypothetical protein
MSGSQAKPVVLVKAEIRVNEKNQPYGGFYWHDISQRAFQKWKNNQDGYGSAGVRRAARTPCSSTAVAVPTLQFSTLHVK